MIKDEMNLTDLYTNPQMTYTETIDTLDDDVLLPYVIGYIPYEWFQDSNLFNWRRVTARQLYVSSTTRIFLEDADQLDGMSASKGVPYMWVAKNVSTQLNGLQYNDQDVWTHANTFYCGNASTTMPQYSAIKNLDLKLINASSSNTKYRVRFCAMIFDMIDGEMQSVPLGIGVFIKSTNFDPYSGEIDDVTFNLSLGTGYDVSYTLNTETFKSFGITGHEIDGSVSDKSYKLFIYCSGIDCYPNITFNASNASKTYVSGMTISETRLRYIPKIGDQYNYDVSGGGSNFIPLSNQGGNGSGCGIYFPYRSVEFSYNYWLNRKDAITPIVEMTAICHVNNDNFIIVLDSVSGSIAVNSYTYQDCITMSFLSAPCIIHDSKLYTPELDDDYKLTGNWVEVTDENRNVNPDTNTFDPSTIPTPEPPSPDSGIDDNDKGSGTNLPNLNRIRSIGAGGFMSYYLLSMSGLLDIEGGLKNAPSTFWEAIGTATDTKMTNLLQYISSLKWYPIDILSGNYGYYPDTSVSEITFGFSPDAKFSFATSQYKLGSTIRVYNMGSISIPYKLGHETFLDKDPYTTVQVWLPFCGLYPIKSDYVVGNTLAFTYIIDLVTGMCTAIVTNDRNTLLNVTGKIGVDYAVTGNDIITQSERMSGAYINGALSAISGGISLGANVASGNVVGSVVSGAGLLSNIAKSSIDIASAKRAVPQAVSSGSGFGSAFAPETPCIIVNPPAIKIPSDYGHATGYVYNQSAKISSMSGLIVCDNPDLSNIVATQAEKNEIYSLLTSGIYV